MPTQSLTGRHLLNRRGFLDNTATGLSSIALSMMLAEQGLLKADDAKSNTVGGKSPIRPNIDASGRLRRGSRIFRRRRSELS
jgi:hypothetical protein